jgi:flavin reductase (DIM6/NTAB) family NADH-FMN oxidoreductase RutF
MHQSGPFFQLEYILKRLAKDGLILVTGDKGNPMTIGWATFGVVWGKPILNVLVRPSRYSYDLIEDNGDFTVNVLGENISEVMTICGTRSGRDTNKIAECNLHLKKSAGVTVPFLDEAEIHFECRTVHKNTVLDVDMNSEILTGYYPSGDLHTIYSGEILGVFEK